MKIVFGILTILPPLLTGCAAEPFDRQAIWGELEKPVAEAFVNDLGLRLIYLEGYAAGVAELAEHGHVRMAHPIPETIEEHVWCVGFEAGRTEMFYSREYLERTCGMELVDPVDTERFISELLADDSD
ncbi:MAG: hypothetical protein AAF911_02430 [Planctomycetota bacterium]